MQQPTRRQLYAYWDRIRNERIAPRRFEIEPAKIASLLRETSIAEYRGLLAFPFRLAGTSICQQFGRELRGVEFLSLWSVHDRDAVGSLVRNIVNDGAVATVSSWPGLKRTDKQRSSSRCRGAQSQGFAIQFAELQDPDNLARTFG